MKAWVFTGAGQPLELEDVPDPQPKPGEVVIDIKATGLCHSDVAALDDPSWAVNFGYTPIVLGHEPVGVVSALGEGVASLAVGDRVGIPSGPPASVGYQRDGAYAEKTTAPADAVVKVPDALDFVRAASGTDAGNVAYHAVVSRGQVRKGEKVGIIGIGGLGQIGARIAVVLGCEVYVAEPKESVWPMARDLGAVRIERDITDLADADLDVIIDFAGFGTTTAGAIDVVRRGGRVIQVGMGRLRAEINTNNLIVKQVDLKGSMGGGTTELAGVWDLMARGDLDPALSIVPFADIDKGLDRLRRGEVQGRLVVDLQNGI
ncbi:zinc-binding dehydrogenase [Streptomyces sp. NPDC097610]|uniref:zinc-binding dehydrogenase n=1 Tax=Streptomyces sp. NPDC097610 TaxID=3157227 RepID=UPI003324E9ED